LPLEAPSSDLEDRILEAERAAQQRAPWHRKLMRGLAWAGSHAMRPQLAMAALFFLVVGSSLLLLRARPGTVAAPVSVTERGTPDRAAPESDGERSKSESAAATAAPGGGRSGADKESSDGRYAKGDAAKAPAAPAAMPADEPTAHASAQAPPPSDAVGQTAVPPGEAPAKALERARDARIREGCEAALPRLAAVAENYPDAQEGKDARRELGECEREMKERAPATKPSAPATAPPVP
jgi:hypothetical protein